MKLWILEYKLLFPMSIIIVVLATLVLVGMQCISPLMLSKVFNLWWLLPHNIYVLSMRNSSNSSYRTLKL